MFIHFRSLDRVKQIAGWLRKHAGIARQTALNIASEMHGYEAWEHLLVHWKDENATASTSLDDRVQQFRAVMTTRGVSEQETILALIDPPRSGDEEIQTISISRDDLARQAAKHDPRVKVAESRLELFHKGDDPTGLIVAASKVLHAAGRYQSTRFFELIKINQSRNPEAALFASNLYLAKFMDDPDGSILLGLLDKALESKFPEILANANYRLGVLLIDSDPGRAKRHMQYAVDANLDSAKFSMAIYLEAGVHGYEKDPEKAMAYYIDCHENHGHQLAKLAIAKAVVLGGRSDLPYNGEQLLAELAHNGQEEAASILRWVNVKRRLESMDVRLPIKVTPAGGNRPKMIRDALVDKFGIAERIAEDITASLYGYESWYALMKAATDKKTPKGPDDEDCTVIELRRRRESQEHLLVEYIGLEKIVAEVCVELLQPTARTARPTLKALEKAMRQRALMQRLGDDYAGMRDVAATLTRGEPDALLCLIYGALPVRPKEPDLLAELDKAYACGNDDEPDPAFATIFRDEPEKLAGTIPVSEKYIKISPWALAHQAFVRMNVAPIDPAEAKRLLLAQLAQFGVSAARPYALEMLGHIAGGLVGGKRDTTAALAYYREAAELGQAEAAFSAARILSDRGTARGTNEAISFYRKAIDLGSEKSRYNLARLLMIRGRISDLDEVRHLMRVAAHRGDHLAIEYMERKERGR